MLRVLELGPFVVQTSLLLVVIGLAVALEVTARISERNNSQSVQNMLWIGFIAFLLGARLSYIALNWPAYQDDLGASISLTPQALSASGGILFAAVAVLLYLRWKQLPIRPHLDIFAPGLAVMVIFVNLGFLAEGAYFGTTTSLPWAIDLWGAERHPTQVYALLGSLLTLVIIVWQQRERNFAGRDFLLVVAGNAITWLLVGLLLADPALIFEQYRQIQLVMWALLMGVGFAWYAWQDSAYAVD